MDVVAQIPVDVGERRPATVLIGSSSDLNVSSLRDPFDHARRLAGSSLRHFVLTDGPRPVQVWDAHGRASIEVTARPPASDTTGAGDVFAAGFIDAYLRGDALEETIRHASGVAGLFLSDRTAFIDGRAQRPRSDPRSADLVDMTQVDAARARKTMTF
nr:carbohydrate kinase family protein [Hansschlegelia zhihuaiae]